MDKGERGVPRPHTGLNNIIIIITMTIIIILIKASTDRPSSDHRLPRRQTAVVVASPDSSPTSTVAPPGEWAPKLHHTVLLLPHEQAPKHHHTVLPRPTPPELVQPLVQLLVQLLVQQLAQAPEPPLEVMSDSRVPAQPPSVALSAASSVLALLVDLTTPGMLAASASCKQSIDTFITRHGTEAHATVRIMPKQREMS